MAANTTSFIATYEDVLESAKRIAPYVKVTPIHTSTTMNELSGRELYFKCELFQRVGAFKFRGACNAILRLSDEELKRGVVAHSSGNHAQAIALAAKVLGTKAYIVMPENSTPVKRRAVEGYGATLITCKNSIRARQETAERLAKEKNLVEIPPYDYADIITGQGTIGIEFLDQVHDLDAMIVPIGGGGMIAGICLAAKALKPSIRIFAAEPAGADDAARSLKSGKIEPMDNPDTIADGLRSSLGTLTFPIIKEYVESVITVDDNEIKYAMRMVWERMKLLIEPSSAVGVAAALSKEFKTIDSSVKNVGIVLCGGNVDLDSIATYLS